MGANKEEEAGLLSTSDHSEYSGQSEEGRDIKTGLPTITEAEKSKAQDRAFYIIVVLNLAPPVFGLLLAWLVYHLSSNKETYDLRIKGASEGDMVYIYISAAIFGQLTFFLNSYPMYLKASVMKSRAGNLRANMYIYKVTQYPSRKKLRA